jgi:thiol-disulfide isomerase/thioredoxin
MFFLSKNSYIYSTLYINLVIFSEKKREKLLKSSEIARKYVIILLLKGRVNMANTKKKSTNVSSNTASKKNNTPKKDTTKKKTTNTGAKKSSTAKKTTATAKKTNTSKKATATKNVNVVSKKKVPVENKEKAIEKKVEKKVVQVEEVKTVDDSKDNATSVNKNNDSTNRMTIVVVICLVVAIIISMVVTSSSGSYNKGNGSSSSASSVEEESNSIKDSEKADLTSIGIDQYLELLKGSEASVIYIGRPTCSHCVIQKPIMEHLVYKYGVKVNYLNTDDLDDDGISKLQSSNEYFSEGWGTPLTLVVKDGDIKDKASGETSIADLVSMFEKYDLIKK